MRTLIVRWLAPISMTGAIVAPQAFARDDLSSMYEGMVEVATGYPTPEGLAPSIVELISRREIEASGAQTLGEVLQRATGVHVSRNRVGDDIFVIRGFYNEVNAQVLILIDGDPLRDPITGSRPVGWEMLPSAIERIEIVRGPGSALLGPMRSAASSPLSRAKQPQTALMKSALSAGHTEPSEGTRSRTETSMIGSYLHRYTDGKPTAMTPLCAQMLKRSPIS